MPRIKCLLVDDHTLFRQGVRRLLETESDFEVIGEAADGGEAVEKAREGRPDVVLMDIGMPGLSSFEAARQIKKNRPETKILFLTMYEDEDYLVQCLEVGASGYVLKDTPAPQLLTSSSSLASPSTRLQRRKISEFAGAGKVGGRFPVTRPRYAHAPANVHTHAARARDSEAAGGRKFSEGNCGHPGSEREDRGSA